MGDKKIIDVRDKKEYEQEHIPEAASMPVSEIEERHLELKKDDEIVVVCNRGGARSHNAAEILQGKGYQNVKILEGGMAAWKDESRN